MKASKKAALCGVSTALGCIFLLLAKLELPITLSLYVLSSIAVMIPLARNLYKGAALTIIATAVISFLLSGIIVFIMYIFFFGLYPLVNQLLNKWINKPKYSYIINLIIKLIIFNILGFIAFSIADAALLVPAGIKYSVAAALISGAFIPYDYIMQLVQKRVSFLVNMYLKM